MTRVFTARVHNGTVAGAELAGLPDGATVTVVISDQEPAELTEDEETELVSRIAEADRGEALVSGQDVLRGLDARRAPLSKP